MEQKRDSIDRTPLATNPTCVESAFDAIIVGGGHNGLITAAYLAKAGRNVAVFERRPIIGGAVCTETDRIPGYRIDVGSSAHIMIHQTPVLKDLALARYGLEYLEMDPWGYSPLPANQGPAIRFYKDVHKTCESIAAVSSQDAEAYLVFTEAWKEINEGALQAFLRAPTPWNLFRSFFGKSIKGFGRIDMLRKIFGPYGQLVEETFENEQLKAAILWLAAQSGPAPSEIASGNFAGWHAMYHQSGMKRAKGGSGALTQALKAAIIANGGTVREDAPVSQILTDSSGKKATGVELENGEEFSAKIVVAACHIKTTVEKLLSEAPLPNRIRAGVAKLRIGNGFGMIVRCAMDSLPNYPGEDLHNGVGDCHNGLQLLCSSRDEIDDAYGDFVRGHPPTNPVPLAMTFSALDPTLAPDGKHVLFVWGQYHPYELRNGENWDAIADREADKLLAAVDRYAPGTSEKVIDRYIQTPLEIERLHGHHRGNVMHLEMSLDQMFFFRPMPELSSYKVPAVKGLYLTGASTHPGGGVWGASGHNTAKVILGR
ncbi:MAG: NAD(P)/FAD-dependent oxidoreductase [Verrucomicrobiota bacterium]